MPLSSTFSRLLFGKGSIPEPLAELLVERPSPDPLPLTQAVIPQLQQGRIKIFYPIEAFGLEILPSKFQTEGEVSYAAVLTRNRGRLESAVAITTTRYREFYLSWVKDKVLDAAKIYFARPDADPIEGNIIEVSSLHRNVLDELQKAESDNKNFRPTYPISEFEKYVHYIPDVMETIKKDMRSYDINRPNVSLQDLCAAFQMDKSLPFMLEETVGTYQDGCYGQGSTRSYSRFYLLSGWKTRFTYIYSGSTAPRKDTYLPQIERDLKLLIFEGLVKRDHDFLHALNGHDQQSTEILARILTRTDWKLRRDNSSLLIPKDRETLGQGDVEYRISGDLRRELIRFGMREATSNTIPSGAVAAPPTGGHHVPG